MKGIRETHGGGSYNSIQYILINNDKKHIYLFWSNLKYNFLKVSTVVIGCYGKSLKHFIIQ